MIKKILEALGLRSEPHAYGRREARPRVSPSPRKSPPYQPYRKEACNAIYNLLFCDDGRAPIGASDDSVPTLRAIAEDESEEGRNRMWAYNRLRAKGEPVSARTLLGTIVEVHMGGGLDVLAAFADGGIRYINHSGSMGIVEGPMPQLEEHVRALLEASGRVVERIGPWTEPRLPPPPIGEVRMTFLVSDGLYFGQGPYRQMHEDIGRPVLVAAENLLTAFVGMEAGSRDPA